MTFTGTSHFVSRGAAVRYYAAYERNPRQAVKIKLREGLIHIGRPPLKPGERLGVIDDGTRYQIASPDEVRRV